MGPKSNDCCLYRDKRRRFGYREEGYIKKKAEIGVILLPTKKFQEPAEAERRKEISPLEPSVGVWSWPHLHLGLLENCERINFSCFKPPYLW